MRPLGNVTTTVYDALGRATQTILPDPDGPQQDIWGTGARLSPVVRNEYDRQGRLRLSVDPTGRGTEVVYDELDRPIATIRQADSAFDRVYEAEEHGWHLTGGQSADGWFADPAVDDAGALSYGPYTRDVPTGEHTATFRLRVGDNSPGTSAALIDVYDLETQQQLASRTLQRDEFLQPNVWQEFTLSFNNPGDMELEFRVYFHDNTTLEHDWVRVTAVPQSGPTWQAETDLSHNVGAATSDGWAADVASYAAGFLAFGPYTTTVPSGAHAARFRLRTDDVLSDNSLLATLDVFDANTGAVLARRDLHRGDFDSGMQWQEFAVPFATDGGDNLEFRVYWHDTGYLELDRVRLPADQVTLIDYDAVGNVTSQTDALGNSTTFAFDNLYRLVSQTDPLGGVTSFTHDSVGNLLSLTDPVNNTTTWAYDFLNRVTSETNELGYTRNYGYDVASNLVSYTDRRGWLTEYDYDFWSRPTEERWKDLGGAVVNTVTYGYDTTSNLTSASDTFSAYTNTFDLLGRLTQTDNFGTPGVPNVVLDSTYDVLGNRFQLSATVDGVADFVNDYVFDYLGWMTSVHQHGQGGAAVADKVVSLLYNSSGEFAEIFRFADAAVTQVVATTRHVYDNFGRLASLTHEKQNDVVLAAYTWTYDRAGRLLTAVTPDGTSNYSYDTTDQLTAATHDYQSNESYAYDLNGNRTAYTIGANNLIESDGTFNYLYDAEGNRTRKTEIATGNYTEYEWDHRNRLTAVRFRDSGGTLLKEVEYTYDVFDRRISKDVDDNGDGTFDRGLRYVYDTSGKFDPATGVALDDIVHVFRRDGSLASRYLHGPAIDQVLAEERFDATGALDDIYWPLGDHQGTIRDLAIYDEALAETTLTEHVRYDSFGNLLDGDPTFLYTYTGREWDPDAEMYYYRGRWYDAAVGRFASEDPIGFAAGDRNLLRYVENSPTNQVDPSGFAPRDGILFLADDVQYHPRSGYVEWRPDLSPTSRNPIYIRREICRYNLWGHPEAPPDWDNLRKFGYGVGGTALGLIGLKALGAKYVVQEAAEYVFEEVTGVPVITDPKDLAESLGKKGAKAVGKRAPRPGSISGNPANRVIDVPTKDGRLVPRHVRMTREDEQCYADAVADRYNQLLRETPDGLGETEKRRWRFENLNKFRREWLDDFYKTRDY